MNKPVIIIMLALYALALAYWFFIVDFECVGEECDYKCPTENEETGKSSLIYICRNCNKEYLNKYVKDNCIYGIVLYYWL